VEGRFRHLPDNAKQDLAKRIHEANIVTACQFCNSTTSRDRSPGQHGRADYRPSQ
jgi:hypothetical protein